MFVVTSFPIRTNHYHLHWKWSGMQDVASILQRTVPKEQSAPISQAESPSESLTTYMTWADKFLTNTTEMEVNARILPLVLDAVSQCDNVIINLQPSVDGHQVFTDFCFVARDEKSLLSLIEAKRCKHTRFVHWDSKHCASAQGSAHFDVQESFFYIYPLYWPTPWCGHLGW